MMMFKNYVSPSFSFFTLVFSFSITHYHNILALTSQGNLQGLEYGIKALQGHKTFAVYYAI